MKIIMSSLIGALSTLLCLLIIVEQTSAICEYNVPPTTEHIKHCYQCLQSDNYQADLGKLKPLNQTLITFYQSKIPKITSNSFQRFKDGLTGLAVTYCQVSEIEDDAFKGLNHLLYLSLEKNNLESVRPMWFKDLRQLTALQLNQNNIKEFDSSVFDHTPALAHFGIEFNRLECFDVNKFSQLAKLKKVELDFNPFSWKCAYKIYILWAKQHPNIADTIQIGTMYMQFERMMEECIKSLGDNATDGQLDECIENKSNQQLESAKSEQPKQ